MPYAKEWTIGQSLHLSMLYTLLEALENDDGVFTAARVCKKVVGRGDMSEYDAWLETSMCPVLDMMQ